MFNRLWFVLVLGFAGFLSACGGGGGDSTTTMAPSTVFQVKAAWVNDFNDSRTLPFTVSGSVNGISVSGSGTLTQGSVSSATFEGVAGLQKTTTITGSMTGGGITAPLSGGGTSYVDTNYIPLGNVGSTYYSVVTGSVNIPQTGVVGDKGMLFIENSYSSSAKTTLLGTAVLTYEIAPDTASTALLKITETDKLTSGATVATTTVTVRMTADGAITRLSESSIAGPISFTATYN